MALNATYWILYGKFEAFPKTADFSLIETIFEQVMKILNSDEN